MKERVIIAGDLKGYIVADVCGRISRVDLQRYTKGSIDRRSIKESAIIERDLEGRRA